MKREDLANGVTRFTKVVLDIMFFGGILATAGIPWLFRWLSAFYPSVAEHYWLHVVLFMLSGVGAVLIIYELRRMFATVLRNDCFVAQNVVSLRRMGVCGFAIAAITAVRMAVVFTPATVVIVIVFLLAGLFSLVLSRVFGEAVRYKEENDLTI